MHRANIVQHLVFSHTHVVAEAAIGGDAAEVLLHEKLPGLHPELPFPAFVE